MNLKKAIFHLKILSLILGANNFSGRTSEMAARGFRFVAAIDITDETMHEQIYQEDSNIPV